jgi:hypothetical protein
MSQRCSRQKTRKLGLWELDRACLPFPPTRQPDCSQAEAEQRSGFGNSDSALGSCRLFLGLLFIGVVIFRTTIILIVDLELLGGFGTLVEGAHRRLTLTRMFIVSVIVVILGATLRVRGENQSLKLQLKSSG